MRTLKEVARHVLHRLGVKRRYAHLRLSTVEQRFTRIYRDGLWQREDGAPPSGAGSSMTATAGVRAELPALLDRIGCRKLLDVGCGDWTWMQHVEISQEYVGIDVVASVIKLNEATHGNGRRLFLIKNAIEDDLPEADVVICRDIFFHLSFEDAKLMLKNIFSKPRNYFIATTDGYNSFNSDIETGDGRLVNLQRPPYRFPQPMVTIADDAVVPARRLALWPAAAIAKTVGLA